MFSAEIACNRALQLKPQWYEALYVRGRVRKDASRITAALRDLEDAESLAPPHSVKEISKLLVKIREENNKCGNRNSISESSECAIRIPGQRHNSFSGSIRRPRVNSSSSYNNNNSSGNGSRSSSPAPPSNTDYSISRSFQPQSHFDEISASIQPPRHFDSHPFHGNENRGAGQPNHINSQEFVLDDRTARFQQNIPYQHRVLPNGFSQYDGRSSHDDVPTNPVMHQQFRHGVPHVASYQHDTQMRPGNVTKRHTYATEL